MRLRVSEGVRWQVRRWSWVWVRVSQITCGSLRGRWFGLCWPGSCCNSHSHSLGTALIWRLLHLESFIRSSQEEAAGSSSLASPHLYLPEPGLNLCAPCSKPYEVTEDTAWASVTDTDLMGLSPLLYCCYSTRTQLLCSTARARGQELR